MGTISLDAAIQAHEQSTRDLAAALDAMMTSDEIATRLALTTCLGALNYVAAYGGTPEARRRVESARKVCRAALGIEDEA